MRTETNEREATRGYPSPRRDTDAVDFPPFCIVCGGCRRGAKLARRRRSALPVPPRAKAAPEKMAQSQFLPGP